MALNLIKLQDDLKMMPNAQIIAYANGGNPMIPPFLALGELNRRKKLQDAFQAEQAKEMAGAPSVKEQIEQSVAPQAGIAGLQPQGMPQQAPQGMPQQAPQQPMMQAPMAPQAPVAQMAGGGFIGDYGTDFEGIASLPVPDNMYSEDNFAGGGIVAFDGREGSFVETSPGFSELSSEIRSDEEEEIARMPLAQRIAYLAYKRQKERPSYAERLKAAGLPDEFVDTTARERAELERREAQISEPASFFDRILELQSGRFGSGQIGASALQFDKARQAQLNEVRKLKAMAEDKREAARIAFLEKRFDKSEANEKQADELDMKAAETISKIGLQEAQTEQAKAGKESNLKSMAQVEFQALVAKGRDPNDPATMQEAYRNAAAYVTYAGPRIDVTREGNIQAQERAAVVQYNDVFDPDKLLTGPLAEEMRAAKKRDKAEGGSGNQNAIRLREYNRIRIGMGLPPVNQLPGTIPQPAATPTSTNASPPPPPRDYVIVR